MYYEIPLYLLLFFCDTVDLPVKVLMRFDDLDFDEHCSGENMTMCKDAIINKIINIASIDQDRVSDLKLQPG